MPTKNQKQSGLPLKKSSISIALLCVTASVSTTASSADVDQEQDKLFKEGIYQRLQGNLFTSIEAFQTVLSNQPTLNRVRLELALSYYKTLNFEEATRQAQLVLDDPKTPENVRIAVLSFLAQVKADQQDFTAKRNTWEPSVSIGLMRDSNVNAGPSSDVLPGGLVLTDQSRHKSDDAYVLTAGISHRYQSPTPVKIGEKAARFIWQTQGNIYRKDYFKENPYDLDIVSVSTGPGLLVPGYFRTAITGQFDYIRYGNEHLANFTSLAPSFTWEIKDGEITADALIQNREFFRAVDSERNSIYYSLGGSVGKVFSSGKLALQGGLHLFTEHAKNNPDGRFSNHGNEIFIGANRVAWDNGSVYGRISQRNSTYDGYEPIYNLKRDETEDRYEIGFNHLYKTGVMANWKLNGSYTFIRNNSNSHIDVYTYKRDIAQINLGRSF